MLLRAEKHSNHTLSTMAERPNLAGMPDKGLAVHHSQQCEVFLFHRVVTPNTHTCSKCESGLYKICVFGITTQTFICSAFILVKHVDYWE